ncbi:hypothetical protein [Nocardia sp. NRRL S-836]|uniref:hypothetical protein n=1 Tax=Nocardia sp. NRRL S-836 TaxID=1519492 RepID=UPI000AAD643A|nr:hypothetical protein [Nocardia sp. NRRL S-836]
MRDLVAARGQCAPGRAAARHRAEQLFLLREDVPAVLVLLVAVTGLNLETVKVLPAEHE